MTLILPRLSRAVTSHCTPWMSSRWPCCCVLFWALSGNTPETRGTAYVVYEDIFDAKNACDHLSGFNVCNRYLVVLYYNANRVSRSGVVSCDSSLWQKMTALAQSNYHYIFQRHKNISLLITGFPEDGHKEERGTAETSEREIRHQHRPSKVALWKSCLCPYREFWPHYP